MFPEAKLGIGPPITDGFYYDFDVPRAFTPEDLEALEKRMRQIVKEGQLFSRRVYESKDASARRARRTSRTSSNSSTTSPATPTSWRSAATS